MFLEEILHKISEGGEIDRVNQQNIHGCRDLGLNDKFGAGLGDGLGCVLVFDDANCLEGSGGWAWAPGGISGTMAC